MATKVNMSKFLCDNCQKSLDKMKRCTRCRLVYYCSQECQINDWSKHKENCQSVKNLENKETNSYNESEFGGNADATTSLEATIKSCESDCSGIKYSRINFEKAANDLKSEPTVESFLEKIPSSNDENHKFYYLNNQSFYDVPMFKSDLPYNKVTVKSDKIKRKFDINLIWTGEEIYKFLSSELEIPLEKLKIINKGKVLTKETISDCVAALKPVFQILGEKSENEEGLDKNDIDVMMKQLGIERNSAVKTLRQKGDLIDAIIEAGNKK
ncbi:hypothetical protein LOTGIDRAFT_228668 [Lottia gigantea]|uniref:MYND-type domain-containing protein n=1 Tax=Lottia gigantea TaxID=225164 RepID=V4BY08_LOTGI|nr:hypothetical protein LOTGIDRAFT_228668 [Lottia gigantea]ESO93989.1 hypothetical protein LOTGIDRAFT_228668 [Lottia gigantea]